MSEWHNLHRAEDVTEEMLASVDDCLDFFEGERLSTVEFIDRFATIYLPKRWDIEEYDSPASRKIMREARRLRRERDA